MSNWAVEILTATKYTFSALFFTSIKRCYLLRIIKSLHWAVRSVITENPVANLPSGSQGQYWADRTPPPNNPPPNMAAANFVVITNGEGCVLNGTAVAAVLINQ